MHGLWLEDGRLHFREDVREPVCAPGEAVVRVLRSGVCNTDLELVRGYYPFTGVPGHEVVGIVDVAPDAPQWVGRRVAAEINATCDACATCAAGRPTHCERRSVLGIKGRDGAHAGRFAIPIANLHAVPDAIDDEAAVFVEPLAAALQIQRQVVVRAADRVVVIGDGKLGNLVAQTLALTGCDLTVVGRHQAKLALLAARGVRATDAAAVDERAADLVVECTGNPDGFDLARRAVRPRGTIVLKSTYKGDARVSFAPLVVDEVTLVGSRCGPFAPALDLLARGLVDVKPLVHARYALRDGVAAFEHAARPGVMKVLLEP